MRILACHSDGDRSIRVVETPSDGSRLYFEDGVLYTHIDAAGNNRLEYVAAMARAVGRASEVLVLGTAGGALATQLSRGGSQVTAVDNVAAAFDIARRWFHLPPTVTCVHADAFAFLRETQGRWDAIAIDVFHGLDIPDSMLTTEIGALLAGRLEPGGSIVWNVADGAQSLSAHWIVKALRLAGLKPSLVSVLPGDMGNTLIVCRSTPI